VTGQDAGYSGEASDRIVVPADVERPDRVIGDLTARQSAILAVAALILLGLWQAARQVVSPVAFLAAASPLAVVAFAMAVGRRDGVSLDRWIAAGLAYTWSPRRFVHAPEGVAAPPAFLGPALAEAARPLPDAAPALVDGVDPCGVIDLGGDGRVLLSRVSTVNFSLRTPVEQDAMIGVFAAWLNGLDTPVEIVVSAHRLDLSDLASGLRHDAAALPHPALEDAALDHADFLADLSDGRDLLHRQVFLTHRESPSQAGPGRDPASGDRQSVSRLLRRADEAARHLAGADLAVTVLDGPAALAVVNAACDPHTPPTRHDPLTSGDADD
jgi:hypothetical protein